MQRESRLKNDLQAPVSTQALARNAEPWHVLAAGAAVPLGVAIAAAYTSKTCPSENVAKTAWIALAIVGSAAVIAAAVATRRIYA